MCHSFTVQSLILAVPLLILLCLYAESKYEKQEARLLTELHALRMRLKSAKDHIKEAEDKAELMEKDVKAVRIFMCELQASLTDTKNQNEKLEELIRQENSMVEQTDCVMCQQCKRSKGWGKLT
ncbi:hypothetical protein L798_10507 [Zootermopsis nevadensis]|uniref:Uncharacterized protein n=1 Tax=Zootermopsis nevadensis TaxID=136037 RepID=A0A067R0Y5_ZOONE|nr:hypothetical protein L798_10507 [Zootermopsis nevadensis]